LICFDAGYADRAPAGDEGFRFRNTFTKYGVFIELIAGDTLEILIQDDLTGQDSFRMMAQGHFNKAEDN